MSLPAAHETVGDYGDDAALVHAHRAGDDEAFDALFRRYYHPLVSWIEWRCHDHARAEDIAQETFAAVARYIGTFDSSRPIWPWLRTIAGHLAGRANRAVGAETPVERLPEHREWSDVIGELDERAAMASALSRLPRRHQTALWMRYAEERPGPECAATLNITPNAFNQLIWRARRLLKSELEALGRGIAAIGMLPFALRRLWHRASANIRVEVAANMSASIAAVTIAAAGLLTMPGLLHGAVPAANVDALPHQTTAAHVETVPAAFRPVHRQTARAGKSGAVHAPTTRGGGDVTVDANAGGASSHVKLAKNPFHRGTVEQHNISIDTPLGGPIVLGGDLTGGPNDQVCAVVDCH